MIVAAAAVHPSTIAAQQRATAPLDVPQSFSGTYGELRHNHFHGGVDFRTEGVTGKAIHAIKDGYVSRLSVSPSGYGNAVYITHPDGTKSVYGHMDSFVAPLAAMVEKKQYEEKSFSVNVYLGSTDYPVSAGDVIGLSGNTGSSGGPHLHLELRDTETDSPFNYIKRGYYAVKDSYPPAIRRICFYSYCDTLPVPVISRIRNLTAPINTSAAITLPHKSYLAIDAVDEQEGTNARLAVDEYKVSLDGEVIFDLKIGDVTPDCGRYIQSLDEYAESCHGGADLIKTLVDPGNLIAIRCASDSGDYGYTEVTAKDRGLIVLEDYDNHTLRIDTYDEHGNRTTLRLTVKRDDSVAPSKPEPAFSTASMLWYLPNVLTCGSMVYSVPQGSLYSDVEVPYGHIDVKDSLSGVWSDVWMVGEDVIPMHASGRMKISCDIPEELREKAFLARYSGVPGSFNLSYAGGFWDEDGIVGRVPFGVYCVSVDTLAPTAKFWENKGNILRSGGVIWINVRDDISGIAEADVEIDGEWYLSQLKRGRVSLILDEKRVRRGTHTVTVRLRDNCGNESETSRKFTW
jgi:Membrane proteins related to metalloendopeptidases